MKLNAILFLKHEPNKVPCRSSPTWCNALQNAVPSSRLSRPELHIVTLPCKLLTQGCYRR
jgi:hypothetical protein